MMTLHGRLPRYKQLWLGVAVCFLEVTTACSYSKGAPYLVRGRDFPSTATDKIVAGMPESQVRMLLGDPLETEHVEQKEVWRYYALKEADGTAHLFGLIPVRTNTYMWTEEYRVTISDGRVEAGEYKFTPVATDSREKTPSPGQK